MSDDVLTELAAIIRDRRSASAEQSYTKSLLEAGPPRCARKFGEEALETVVAALGDDPSALKAEAADVLYHLLVLLEVRGVSIEDVLAVLRARQATSGHAEKASRQTK
jgi:phosphoribosyl-ATP pyrophosphohydrolase